MSNQTKNLKIIILICLILIVTFFAFSPSLKNGFINWDDPEYVIENSAIKDFSGASLKEAFSRFFIGNYQPLVIVSYAIDYQLFGLNPFGYHLTNLIIHLMNCLLVFWLIYIFTQKYSVSLIVAMLFAVHPLRVESVVWISERKDLLYSFFSLSAMICYVYYIRGKHKARNYYLAFFLFALSLLSKSMAITLPIVLLLIDYFINRKRDRSMLTDKIPFFLLSLVFSIIAILGQYSIGAVRSENMFDLLRKAGIASYSFVFYLYKIFVPLKLSSFYIYSDIENIAPDQLFLYSFLICAVLLGLTLFSSRYTRKVIFGMMFFAVTILPVLQFFPIGGTIVADRYSYMASIGIFYLIAEGSVRVMTKQLKSLYAARIIIFAFLILTVGTLSALTRDRCSAWKDSVSFWNDILSKYPKGSALVYNSLGNAYHEAGEYKKEIEMLKKSIEADPGYLGAYSNLAGTYSFLERKEEALDCYKRAIEIAPDSTELYLELGKVYDSLGRKEEAVSCYRQAIEIDPHSAKAYCRLGITYYSMGDNKYAEDMFRRSLELNQSYMPAYHNLVNLCRIKGDEAEIMLLYKKAVLNNVNYLDAFLNIAGLYGSAGNDRKAIMLYLKALEIDPQNIDAYVNLGRLYCIVGNYRGAIKALKKALELEPNQNVAHNNLAAAYYYEKKYDLAVKHFDRAAELGYKVSPKFLELLKPYRK